MAPSTGNARTQVDRQLAASGPGMSLGERQAFLVVGFRDPFPLLDKIAVHVADERDRAAEADRAQPSIRAPVATGCSRATTEWGRVSIADITASRFAVVTMVTCYTCSFPGTRRILAISIGAQSACRVRYRMDQSWKGGSWKRSQTVKHRFSDPSVPLTSSRLHP